ncbi:hypothetical protein SAMN03097699_0832 [Flavobacteriaceae bacterium MAR_2010_188]|nr:hypothetical protein SAMN03097699_0832 [Flavobacteriaceae bacterium MAR_2010_188]
MTLNRLKYFHIILILAFAFVSTKAKAQGYAEDSLQIKVYSEINYESYRPVSIKITKVFCEYCSPNQLKHIKGVAYETAYGERNAPENVMKNGKKKLAIYLRLPKDKFRLLRDEQRRRR